MATADTAKLIAQLTLDDKGFSRGIDSAVKKTGQLESTLGNVGRRAGAGLQSLGRNLATGAIIGVGALTTQVYAGIKSLEELERVTNATNAVITSTGGVAGQTTESVRELANELEDLTTADDKAIQAGENMLLTFTNIGKEVFPDATKAVVNLAIAMADGDVEAANFSDTAIQVGKALNDPIRGVTALRRVGVSFTEQQLEQIKVLQEAGKTADAQRIILAELEKEFGKAGEAAGQGFGADMRRFGDAVEEAQMALASGFLPLMNRVADVLQTELAKPENLKAIEEFGVSLADSFGQILSAAEKIPWDSIKSAIGLAAEGAKGILTAFTSLPPWVQTAVLTGWGLNKLTGGALGGIVGELGKGLIKGVLGIQAAQVNITAANVTGAGGVPGAAGGKGGGGILGAVGAITIAGFTLAAANEIGTAIVNATGGPTGGAGREIAPGIIIGQSQAAAGRGVQPVKDEDVAKEIEQANRESAVRDTHTSDRIDALKADQAAKAAAAAAKITTTNSELARTRQAEAAHAAQLASSIRTTNSELQVARISAAQNAAAQKATTAAGLADVRGAIQSKNFSPKVSVTVNNPVSISVRDTIYKQKTFKSVFHHAE